MWYQGLEGWEEISPNPHDKTKKRVHWAQSKALHGWQTAGSQEVMGECKWAAPFWEAGTQKPKQGPGSHVCSTMSFHWCLGWEALPFPTPRQGC